jgi:hypothetical protein
MCDFEKGFILCTCEDKEKPIIHNKNSRRNKKNQINDSQVYRWYLYEFVEKHALMMIGRYLLPTSDLGNSLTAEWVLLNLNERHCFDFDYTPKEGDNLIMRAKHLAGLHLSFIFREGIWLEDHYDAFNYTLKLNLEGEIKQI